MIIKEHSWSSVNIVTRVQLLFIRGYWGWRSSDFYNEKWLKPLNQNKYPLNVFIHLSTNMPVLHYVLVTVDTATGTVYWFTWYIFIGSCRIFLLDMFINKTIAVLRCLFQPGLASCSDLLYCHGNCSLIWQAPALKYQALLREIQRCLLPGVKYCFSACIPYTWPVKTQPLSLIKTNYDGKYLQPRL